VAKPHTSQIRTRAARASHCIEWNYPIFSGVTFRHLYTNIVKRLKIVFGDGWHGSSCFSLFNESPEGFQSFSLRIAHLGHLGMPMVILLVTVSSDPHHNDAQVVRVAGRERFFR